MLKNDTPSAEDDAPLTAEQVAELPEGAPITVTWSGGNGPHAYVVAVDKRGQRYAVPSHVDPHGRLRYYNPLDFVGQKRFHTRVWTRAIPPGAGDTDA